MTTSGAGTSDASKPASAAGAPSLDLDWRVVRAFTHFAGGFWRGEGARRAWALTIALAICLLLSTAATVALTHWTRWFFDALERRDAAALWHSVTLFLLIIASMAAIGVGVVLTRERLQVHWRAWVVGEVVSRWLSGRRFYHLTQTGMQPANPEYRIADDSRWASEPLVDLGIGLVTAIISAAAFISILWSVGGSYALTIGGTALTIPAYMVLLALAYGIIGSLLTMWIGRRLVGFVGRKNEAEGDFRFALMRLRDNAESVAMMGGEQSERRILARIYDTVVQRWLRIVQQHGRLTWITNSIGPMTPIVPLLFAAPKYLVGELTLGEVTQLAAAFSQVQMAISWVVDNFSRIAEWYASARRVMDMVDACAEIDRHNETGPRGIEITPSPSEGLVLEGIAVHDPGGRPLVARADLMVPPATSLSISGDTSSGKTALVRAIAGLWREGHGTVRIGAQARIMIAPQQGYLPLATLREALIYPADGASPADNEITAALNAAGLAHLADKLDETGRWDQSLSAGERQRIAIARLLLHRPDVIILDDAMTALDESTRADLLLALRETVPEAAILNVGQSPRALPGAGRILKLERQASGTVLGDQPQPYDPKRPITADI
jgi:vitamin B12/bleomycin/antimicrobial peptide transport system ATP-binding/permease protein